MVDNSKTARRLNLLALTWPIFAENCLRMLLGNVNIFMLGKHSDKAVAAVGVSTQLINMILMIYSIVSVGTAVIISQSLGAGEKKVAAKVVNVAIIFNFLFGLVISIVVASGGKVLLRMMNLPEELMEYALPYLRIIAGASFTQALLATMSAISRNYGQTKAPMAVAIGMNIINAIANYMVTFRPFGITYLGVKGIAFSVVISQAIAVIVMFYILFKYLDLGLKFELPRPFPLGALKNILNIGLPAAGATLSYNISQVVATYIVTMLGTEALTTKIYMGTMIGFLATLGMSIAQANQIMIGHLVGANEQEKAYTECLKSVKIAILCDFTVAVICFIFRKQLFGMYTQSPSIIAMGGTLLFISLILEPGRCFNMVLGSALQASGDVRFPVIVGIVSCWGVSIALSYILGISLGLGLPGIFVAFTIDEWTRGIIQLMRWRSGIWKSKRVIKTLTNSYS
ncbi:MAG: family efflux transporter [Clostridia bacterium]|nr:family efflux transporter [Clostridia bacterium]